MGAELFYTWANGMSAEDAFTSAREEALYDYGHRGYTGTIAEKTEIVMIECPRDEDPETWAEKLINGSDERVDDKWGPAGCIYGGPDEQHKGNKYLFFGWASC